MSGISQPDRQVECSGCGRILTLLALTRTTQKSIRCPGCLATTELPLKGETDARPT